MGALVRVVVTAAKHDDVIIEAQLGVPPLPVEPVPGVAILVDGRFHTAACRWLTYRSAGKRATTVKENAKHLAAWISYLRAVRGYDSPDEAKADVFVAAEDDLLAYRAHLQHGIGAERVGPAAWAARLSTIKQFHEYASRRWGLAMPFTLTTAYTAHGAMVTTTGLSPRVKQGSVGSPLDPVYAEQLIQGAWRTDADGEEHGDDRVQRDAAFINLGLGTGARRRSLSGITIHELPPPRETLFNTLRVADLITKGDRGGDTFVFEHRLRPVRDYVAGARTDLLDLTRKHHRPDDPLTLTQADRDGWAGADRSGRKSGHWNDTDLDTRLRMVHEDGTSPMLWLSTRSGRPLSYRQCHAIVGEAAAFVRSHINPDFPARFRPHDLRHTFAVHMAVTIVRGRVDNEFKGTAGRAFATSLVRDAVHVVSASLGHTNPGTTSLYLTHAAAQLMNELTLDAYTGGSAR